MTFVKKTIIPNGMQDWDKIFEEEILIHIDAVLNYAYRLTRNLAKAEDLTQEVMLRAKMKIEQYTPGTNGKAWVMKITFSFFVNDWKRQGKREKLTSELDERTVCGMADSGGNSIELERGNLIDIVSDELYVLLKNFSAEKLAILLLTAEGFKGREIAEIMNIPEGTVKSNLSRMRDVLIHALSGSTLAKETDDSDECIKVTKGTKGMDIKGNRRSDSSPMPTND